MCWRFPLPRLLAGATLWDNLGTQYMADYPGSIYDQRTITNYPGIIYDPDNETRMYAEDLRFLGDEITAIETTLGLNPQGVRASVAARLDAIEAEIASGGGGGGGEPLCTGAPESPELVFAFGDIVMS